MPQISLIVRRGCILALASCSLLVSVAQKPAEKQPDDLEYTAKIKEI